MRAVRGRCEAYNSLVERASWPVRLCRLGQEPREDLAASTSPAARLGMMWGLAREAWALTGRTLPVYDRHEAQVLRRCLRETAR